MPSAGLLRRRRHAAEHELSITAFMNLMVVLIPFLLVIAVFSRIVTLELYLPTPSEQQAQSQAPPAFSLTIFLRQDGIAVGNGREILAGLIKQGADYPWEELSKVLQRVKKEFPGEDTVAILAEPTIEYETLVRAMDVSRMAVVEEGGAKRSIALFPNVSIGEVEAAPAPGAAS
ncbi:MAG: biopolymer transporter ExbD [Nitrospirota bacterium]